MTKEELMKMSKNQIVEMLVDNMIEMNETVVQSAGSKKWFEDNFKLIKEYLNDFNPVKFEDLETSEEYFSVEFKQLVRMLIIDKENKNVVFALIGGNEVTAPFVEGKFFKNVYKVR